MPPRCPAYSLHPNPDYRCHRNDCSYCGRLNAAKYFEAFEDEVRSGIWLGITLTLSHRHVSSAQSFDKIKELSQIVMKRMKRSQDGFEGYLGVIDVHQDGWAHAHVMVKMSGSIPYESIQQDTDRFVNNWFRKQVNSDQKRVAEAHIQVLDLPVDRWYYHTFREGRPWDDFKVWPYPPGYRTFFFSQNFQRNAPKVSEQIDIL